MKEWLSGGLSWRRDCMLGPCLHESLDLNSSAIWDWTQLGPKGFCSKLLRSSWAQDHMVFGLDRSCMRRVKMTWGQARGVEEGEKKKKMRMRIRLQYKQWLWRLVLKTFLMFMVYLGYSDELGLGFDYEAYSNDLRLGLGLCFEASLSIWLLKVYSDDLGLGFDCEASLCMFLLTLQYSIALGQEDTFFMANPALPSQWCVKSQAPQLCSSPHSIQLRYTKIERTEVKGHTIMDKKVYFQHQNWNTTKVKKNMLQSQ